MPEPDFYITGGTIPPDAPSYVARRADEDLLSALRRGDTCYVLNARQMGKSSLCVRTRAALEREGIRTAFLDLQKFGSSATAEQWYRSLLERLGHDLKLRTEFLTYWRENGERTPIDRLMGALREVALERIPGPLVVFLDEIDVVRDLGFKTDEFFAAIRQCYNARVEDPDFQRLRFCIIGTVAPTDLIQDVRLSPFNIGTRIVLADFTAKEAAPLAEPLAGGSTELERVLWWTAGHPYLTQRLCAELSRSGSRDVDGTAARLFLAKSEADVDENIKNVRNASLRMGGEGSGVDRVDLLTRYGQLVAGKRVPDDDTDAVCAALRLSGLVRSEGGRLRIRNRIYARVFDRAWVERNLPDAEVRRQRAAYRQGLLRALALSGAVMLALAALAGYAFHQANRADWFAQDALAQKIAALGEKRLANQQSELATRNATEAQRQRRLAENRTVEAEKERRTATEALGEANRQRLAATSAAAAAERARHSATAAAAEAEKQRRAATAAAAEAERQRQAATIALGQAKQQKGLADTRLILANQNLQEANRARGAEANAKLEALQKAEQARLAAERAERAVYVADMNVVQRDWAAHNIENAGKILQETRASPFRGFEWGYWNRELHQDLRTIEGDEETVASLQVSPDGSRLLMGGGGGSARIWDVASGHALAEVHTGYIWLTSAQFSSDGTRVLALMAPNRIRRHTVGGPELRVGEWDAATGQRIRSVTLHSQGGWHANGALSPRGRYFCGREGGPNGFGKLSIWDTATGSRAFPLGQPTDQNGNVAFSPDERRLAAEGADAGASGIRIWDLATRKSLVVLEGERRTVHSLAFSPDGKLVASGNESGNITVWNAGTGKQLLQIQAHAGDVECVAFAPDGSKLVSGGADNTARIWDLPSGRESLTLYGHSGGVISATFTADGRRLFTGSEDGSVKEWDVTRTSDDTLVYGGVTVSAAFTPNKKQILSANLDGIRTFETATHRQVALQPLLAVPDVRISTDPWTPTTSPDGKRCIVGTVNGIIIITDLATGKPICQTKIGNEYVTAVAWRADGKCVYASDWDGTNGLYDPATGNELVSFPRHPSAAWCAAFSSDGKRLVTGGLDGVVRVRDAATGSPLLELRGHRMQVDAVTFSPDGGRILSGSSDKTARVWDAATGKQLLLLSGHTERVASVGFSPDGKRILTGSDDDTVKLWDAVSGRETLTLNRDKSTSEYNRVRSATFSSDGTRILAGGTDGVQVWTSDFTAHPE